MPARTSSVCTKSSDFAATFEVLTGGDLAVGDAEGHDDQKQSDGREVDLRFIPLPPSMIDAMRVSLHVWADAELTSALPITTGGTEPPS